MVNEALTHRRGGGLVERTAANSRVGCLLARTMPYTDAPLDRGVRGEHALYACWTGWTTSCRISGGDGVIPRPCYYTPHRVAINTWFHAPPPSTIFGVINVLLFVLGDSVLVCYKDGE